MADGHDADLEGWLMDAPELLPESDDDADHRTLRLAVEEARREYGAEVDTLDEIDEKALRAVRTSVLVVGFVASAFGIGGPSAAAELSLYEVFTTGLGVGLLIVAIVMGAATAAVTEYPSGVGATYRGAMISNASDKRLQYLGLTKKYDRFAEEVAQEVAANESLLNTAQMSLVFGMVLLASAAGSLVIRASTDIPSDWAMMLPVTALGILILAAGRLTRRSV